MPTITQYVGGDPASIFFTGRFEPGTEILFESGAGFYWATTGKSGGTVVYGGGVVVGGTGLAYSGETLVSGTPDIFRAIASYAPNINENNPVVTFSELPLSPADTMAILQGNTARLRNIIDANQWDYNGSNVDDTFTAAAFADHLIANGGSDTMHGMGGNDIIEGGAGIDKLYGDADRDRLFGGSENDSLYGGTGNDKLDGGSGSDYLEGGTGDDIYYVDTNSDRVRDGAGQGYDSVFATDDFTLFPTAEIELLSAADVSLASMFNLRGNDFSQTIVGNAGSNKLEGEGGGDILDGRGGADQMFGGEGNDSYIIDDAGDIVDESAAGSNGVDTIRSSVRSIFLGDSAHFKGAIEQAAVDGGLALNLTGNGLNNYLQGNSAANTLNGNTGADTMKGLGGNDVYIVDNAGDVVDELAAGSTGVDTVRSSTVSINLFEARFKGAIEQAAVDGNLALNVVGSSINNYLQGNGAANGINGGLGNDTLKGNGGADRFYFSTALGSTNIDTINDFAIDDTIYLTKAIFSGITAIGTLAAAAFASNTTGLAGDASDRIIYETDTGKLFYDADGLGGAVGGIHFATLPVGLALTNADFVVT